MIIGIKQKKYTKQLSAGFSFVELLVSLGIFTTIAVIAAGSYALSIQLERRSEAYRAIYQNASYLYEFIGKEIRNSSLYYDIYPSGQIPKVSNDLWLQYRNDPAITSRIYRDLTDDTIKYTRLGDPSGDILDIPITGDDVKVISIGFYTEPTEKCTVVAPVNCYSQEFVTVTATIQANTHSVSFLPATILQHFQTTFSIRRYED